jgi:hypothetical protein
MATISKQNQLVEYDTYWLVPLHGKTVTRCFVDSAFGIEFWEHGNVTTIRIEGPFTFETHGATQRLFPEHPTALGPALSTLSKTVTAVHAYKDGCLEVRFADGSSLSAKPDVEYEAWEIVGSDGLRVVCTPEGCLSIWRPVQGNNGS